MSIPFMPLVHDKICKDLFQAKKDLFPKFAVKWQKFREIEETVRQENGHYMVTKETIQSMIDANKIWDKINKLNDELIEEIPKSYERIKDKKI